MIMRAILFMFLMVTVIYACSESTFEDEQSINYEYYPLSVGNEWTYEVDSILLFKSGFRDTAHYFMKEEIVERLDDNGGYERYLIERSYREDESKEWEVVSYIKTGRSVTNAYKEINNLRIPVLGFPVRNNASWKISSYFDPNGFHFIGPDSLQLYKNWNQANISNDMEEYTIDGQSFSNGIKVVLAENETVVDIEDTYLIFAEGIGMINYHQLNYADPTGNLTQEWEDKVKLGILVDKRLISYNIQ